MPKKLSGNKKGRQSNFAKLSIFQPKNINLKKAARYQLKVLLKIDYKNIKS